MSLGQHFYALHTQSTLQSDLTPHSNLSRTPELSLDPNQPDPTGACVPACVAFPLSASKYSSSGVDGSGRVHVARRGEVGSRSPEHDATQMITVYIQFKDFQRQENGQSSVWSSWPEWNSHYLHLGYQARRLKLVFGRWCRVWNSVRALHYPMIFVFSQFLRANNGTSTLY